MNATASVSFRAEELWFLQSVVRHEMQQQDTWKFPPASLELNDQIADVLAACEEHGLTEGTLILSKGDLLLLDFVVPQSAKTVNGVPIGRPILVKTFRARRELASGPDLPDAVEPEDMPTINEIDKLIAKLDAATAVRKED